MTDARFPPCPCDVACLGETMALVTPTLPGPLATAASLTLTVAGAESTVAMYLADLGVRSSWISRVGADPLGERVVSFVAARGVDTTCVAVDPTAPTGVFFKDVVDGRSRVHYYRRGSAASQLSLKDGLTALGLAPKVLHVTGVTAALSESCRSLMEGIGRQAQVQGITLSFDVNFRPGLWSATEAAPVLAQLARSADLLFVGLDEAATLWQTTDPHEVRDLFPQPAEVIVKDGAVGATAFVGDAETFVATPPADVVELVGAGDAFAAGYLAGRLQGRPADERLALGHALAGHAIGSTADYRPFASHNR